MESEARVGKVTDNPVDTPAPTAFERLGGEAKVRPIIDAFMDCVFEDRMIGFFFRTADKRRIKEFEYQLAAEFLGAPLAYRGRNLQQAHARHPIMGGHFARRRQILKETLDAYAVPEDIKQAWLDHTDALRSLITPEAGSGCDPIAARDRVRRGA
jgi:hemoglobin